MKMSSTQTKKSSIFTVSGLKFEGVDSFTYLVSVVKNENKMRTVIPKP
jgi:hypothetical protein